MVPVTIFTYRAQLGAADPTDVFLPILIATYCSTLVGLLVTSLFQKIRLYDPVVLGYLGGMTALIAGLVAWYWFDTPMIGVIIGAAMVSDAFFPFRDGIDTAAGAGIKAVIQPGGSKGDQSVIDACNEHGVAMVFTGRFLVGELVGFQA